MSAKERRRNLMCAKDTFDKSKHVMHSLESIPPSCNRCKFYEDGVRDDYGKCHAVCTYMPISQMWLTPFEVIDGIDTSKERAWWCHYNSVEQRGKQE